MIWTGEAHALRFGEAIWAGFEPKHDKGSEDVGVLGARAHGHEEVEHMLWRLHVWGTASVGDVRGEANGG